MNLLPNYACVNIRRYPNFNAVMIPDDVDLVDVDAIFERNPVLTAGDAGDNFFAAWITA